MLFLVAAVELSGRAHVTLGIHFDRLSPSSASTFSINIEKHHQHTSPAAEDIQAMCLQEPQTSLLPGTNIHIHTVGAHDSSLDRRSHPSSKTSSILFSQPSDFILFLASVSLEGPWKSSSLSVPFPPPPCCLALADTWLLWRMALFSPSSPPPPPSPLSSPPFSFPCRR